MKSTYRIAVSLLAFAFAGFITGCGPKDISLLNEGTKLEFKGNYNEAADKYAEAASLGNVLACKKLGDILVSYKYANLRPQNSSDYCHGYDKWLEEARDITSRAAMLFDKAEMGGCTEPLAKSREKLAACEKQVAEISEKVARAKDEDAKRRAEADRIAKDNELRKNPDYCISHGYVLSEDALRKIRADLHYVDWNSDELVSEKEEERNSRYLKKVVKIKGEISAVETTLFSNEVKCKIVSYGVSVSARFDGLPKSDSRLKVGNTVTFTGSVSNRPTFSDLAVDYCKFVAE